MTSWIQDGEMKFSRIWITELRPNCVRIAKIWFHSTLYILINVNIISILLRQIIFCHQKVTNHTMFHIIWSICHQHNRINLRMSWMHAQFKFSRITQFTRWLGRNSAAEYSQFIIGRKSIMTERRKFMIRESK